MVDACPGSNMRDSVHVPNELDLSALTSLARLELCGYTDDGNVLHRDFPDFSGDQGSAIDMAEPSCRIAASCLAQCRYGNILHDHRHPDAPFERLTVVVGYWHPALAQPEGALLKVVYLW